MKTVLITGASSGIGYEFAKIYAENNFNLVLVARNTSKLNELKKVYRNIRIDVFELDLSKERNIKKLYLKLKARKIKIYTLINNAGFGLFGLFSKTDINKELSMINLNIKTVVILTKYFLKDMLENNEGYILNVASIASFQPGPLMSIYYATKSFILSFTEAIQHENRKSNIVISALCPGPTDTNFEKSPNLDNAGLVKKLKVMHAKEVAQIAYEKLHKKERVIIPGFTNKTVVFFQKFIPRNFLLHVTRKIQESKS